MRQSRAPDPRSRVRRADGGMVLSPEEQRLRGLKTGIPALDAYQFPASRDPQTAQPADPNNVSPDEYNRQQAEKSFDQTVQGQVSHDVANTVIGAAAAPGEVLKQGAEAARATGRGDYGDAAKAAALAALTAASIPRGGLVGARGSGKAFYSALEDAAQNAKIPAATGEQWAGYLRNQPNVKPEEFTWTGLDDFLQSKPKFTRDDVAQYLAENKTDVREVWKGELSDEDRARLEPLMAARDRIEDDLNNAYRSRDRLYTSPEKQSHWQAQIDRLRSERQATSDKLDSAFKLDGVPKYKQYTEPGGTNYKELLLTLPGEHPARGDVNYTSGHWDEPNVLAHVRMDDRVSADGKKTLFLEELQSDLHQEGRTGGYARPLRKPENMRPVDEIDRDMDAIQEQLPDLPPEQVWGARPDLQQRYRELQSERNISQAFRDGYTTTAGAVPDAPFKGQRWSELALKRIFKYAADNNYDRVAWTPGSVQAARFPKAQGGLKSWYDDILPTIAGSIGKKYGMRVGQSDVQGVGKAWSVDLTPDAKNAAGQGMPLFSIGLPAMLGLKALAPDPRQQPEQRAAGGPVSAGAPDPRARPSRWYDFLPDESVDFLDQAPGAVKGAIEAWRNNRVDEHARMADPTLGRSVISGAETDETWRPPGGSPLRRDRMPNFNPPNGAFLASPFDLSGATNWDRQAQRALNYKGPAYHDTDPEGRPLDSLFVAGLGERDHPLSVDQVKNLSALLTEGSARVSNMGSVPDGKVIGEYLPATNSILYNKNADPDFLANRAIPHETGHAISALLGGKSSFALTRRLMARPDWNVLEAEIRGLPDQGFAGTHATAMIKANRDAGVPDADVVGSDELIAEALSRYMTNPGWFKYHAPQAARALRDIINTDPHLSKYFTLSQRETEAPLQVADASGGTTQYRASGGPVQEVTIPLDAPDPRARVGVSGLPGGDVTIPLEDDTAPGTGFHGYGSNAKPRRPDRMTVPLETESPLPTDLPEGWDDPKSPAFTSPQARRYRGLLASQGVTVPKPPQPPSPYAQPPAVGPPADPNSIGTMAKGGLGPTVGHTVWDRIWGALDPQTQGELKIAWGNVMSPQATAERAEGPKQIAQWWADRDKRLYDSLSPRAKADADRAVNALGRVKDEPSLGTVLGVAGAAPALPEQYFHNFVDTMHARGQEATDAERQADVDWRLHPKPDTLGRVGQAANVLLSKVNRNVFGPLSAAVEGATGPAQAYFGLDPKQGSDLAASVIPLETIIGVGTGAFGKVLSGAKESRELLASGALRRLPKDTDPLMDAIDKAWGDRMATNMGRREVYDNYLDWRANGSPDMGTMDSGYRNYQKFLEITGKGEIDHIAAQVRRGWLPQDQADVGVRTILGHVYGPQFAARLPDEVVADIRIGKRGLDGSVPVDARATDETLATWKNADPYEGAESTGTLQPTDMPGVQNYVPGAKTPASGLQSVAKDFDAAKIVGEEDPDKLDAFMRQRGYTPEMNTHSSAWFYKNDVSTLVMGQPSKPFVEFLDLIKAKPAPYYPKINGAQSLANGDVMVSAEPLRVPTDEPLPPSIWGNNILPGGPQTVLGAAELYFKKKIALSDPRLVGNPNYTSVLETSVKSLRSRIPPRMADVLDAFATDVKDHPNIANGFSRNSIFVRPDHSYAIMLDPAYDIGASSTQRFDVKRVPEGNILSPAPRLRSPVPKGGLPAPPNPTDRVDLDAWAKNSKGTGQYLGLQTFDQAKDWRAEKIAGGWKVYDDKGQLVSTTHDPHLKTEAAAINATYYYKNGAEVRTPQTIDASGWKARPDGRTWGVYDKNGQFVGTETDGNLTSQQAIESVAKAKASAPLPPGVEKMDYQVKGADGEVMQGYKVNGTVYMVPTSADPVKALKGLGVRSGEDSLDQGGYSAKFLKDYGLLEQLHPTDVGRISYEELKAWRAKNDLPFPGKAMADVSKKDIIKTGGPVPLTMTPGERDLIDKLHWPEAMKKGLDLSEGARLSRAKDQGYNTEEVWFHGSSNGGIEKFNPSKGSYGKNGATYFAADPGTASSFGGALIPVFVKTDRILDLTKPATDNVLDAIYDANIKGIPGVNQGAFDKEFQSFEKALKKGISSGEAPGYHFEDYFGKASNELEKMGYDGVYLSGDGPNRQIMLWNHSGARHIDATFDPDKVNLPDLYSEAKPRTGSAVG